MRWQGGRLLLLLLLQLLHGSALHAVCVLVLLLLDLQRHMLRWRAVHHILTPCQPAG